MKVFDLIKRYYTDPETGFISRRKLLHKIREAGYDITMKEINAFYKHFEPTQLYKPLPKKVNFPIVGTINSFQCDLIFYPRYKKQNKGYSGAFIAVGINSRYAYGYLFKSKASKDINPILRQFIQDARDDGKEITMLESDSGSEFLSKSAQQIFKDSGIVHNTSQPGDHRFLGKIDAFSRTIKKRISQYFTANNTVKWFDVFPELIYNYNHTVHSSIKMEPANVSEIVEEKILNDAIKRYRTLKKQTASLKKGDFVRIPNKKETFQKEGTTYQNDIYTIADIFGTKISVRNANGNLLKTKYPINQVLKIPKHSMSFENEEKKKADKEARIHRQVRKEGLEPDYRETNARISNPRISKFMAYQKMS